MKPSPTVSLRPVPESFAIDPMRRRSFLGRLGWIGAATGWAATFPAAHARTRSRLAPDRCCLMLDEVTHNTFAPHVGDAFQLEIAPGQRVQITLTEATPMPLRQQAGAEGRRPGFSILFRAPAGSELPQRIYAIDHAVLGRMEVFLVPVGCDAAGLQLEAVFN